MAQDDWIDAPVRDTDASVRWAPAIAVSPSSHTFAGVTNEGAWVVGRPGSHVLMVDHPAGAIGLLPLLERDLDDVRMEIAHIASRFECSPLRLERVVDAAFDERASPYWAERAVWWLDGGFPSVWYLDALRRVADDRRVNQRARQTASRLVASTTSMTEVPSRSGPPCSLEHLDRAETALGVSLPANLRALFEAGDGRFRQDGQWWVVWRLDRVVQDTLAAWAGSLLPASLVAFGDDGTGSPFCVSLDATDVEVVRWSWIDAAIEQSEGPFSEFIGTWVGLGL